MGIPEEELLQQPNSYQTLRQIAYQQINQAQMAQGISSDWANALGGAMGGMGSGMAQGIYQPQVSPIPYQMPMGSSDYGDRITFSRINTVVTIDKYQVLSNINMEPLDELRIKVAKWLYN